MPSTEPLLPVGGYPTQKKCCKSELVTRLTGRRALGTRLTLRRLHRPFSLDSVQVFG